MKHIHKTLLICLGLSFSAITVTGCGPSIDFAQRNPLWAQPVDAEGLDNLFKVSDDLYRSAQPDKGGMTSAKDLGIKTVISIRETEKDSALNEQEQTNLHLVHIPLETTDISTEEIIEVMKAIKEGPKPVLIHCRHGSDRTGLMVGLYRVIFENWDKEAAVDELKNGGYGYHKMFKSIPQTLLDADIDYIKNHI